MVSSSPRVSAARGQIDFSRTLRKIQSTKGMTATIGYWESTKVLEARLMPTTTIRQ